VSPLQVPGVRLLGHVLGLLLKLLVALLHLQDLGVARVVGVQAVVRVLLLLLIRVLVGVLVLGFLHLLETLRELPDALPELVQSRVESGVDPELRGLLPLNRCRCCFWRGGLGLSLRCDVSHPVPS
jgi:hypothetical protein